MVRVETATGHPEEERTRALLERLLAEHDTHPAPLGVYEPAAGTPAQEVTGT